MNKISRFFSLLVSDRAGLIDRIKGRISNRDIYLDGLEKKGLVSYSKKTKTYYRDIHGLEFHLMPNDTGISRALAEKGTREEESVIALHKYVSPDMTIFDLGANIGFYVCLEAQIIKKAKGTGKIYAIEPSPFNVNMVNTNVRANGFEDIVQVHQGAISNKTEQVQFLIAEASNWSKLASVKEDGNKGNLIDVSSYTIHDFFKKTNVPFSEIDFLRMDVEGAEYDFFPDIYEDLQQKESFLMFVEFHPHINIQKHIETLKKLEEIGFKCIDATKEWSLENGGTGRKHVPDTTIQQLYTDDFLTQFGGVEVFLKKE